MKALILILAIFVFPAVLFLRTDVKKLVPQSDTLTIPTNAPITNIATPFTIEFLRKRDYKKSQILLEKAAYSTTTFSTYLISYDSEGSKLFALLSIPKEVSKNSPILILNHGYIDPQNYSTMESYRNPFDYFASKGFIVLKPDYRANGNSGGDRKDPLNRLSYPVDVLNLIASLPTLNAIDTPFIHISDNPLFLWGHSMGGDITLKVTEVLGKKISGISLWAPVSTPYPESMLYYLRKGKNPDYEKIKELVYKFFSADDFVKLSPSENTHLIKSRLILHHGTADESVPYEWSIDLVKKLTQNKIKHTFYSYNNEDHNFSHGAHATVLKRDLEFFMSKK